MEKSKTFLAAVRDALAKKQANQHPDAKTTQKDLGPTKASPGPAQRPQRKASKRGG